LAQIARAAWECADPGLQFDTTINKWHTSSNTDRINGSNPCSEYMHIDNSACNLASLNLMKYLLDDGSFDVDAFNTRSRCSSRAQEIIVGAATTDEKIAENSRKFRQLGSRYANLGALLMASGLAYDSDEGRAWAGASHRTDDGPRLRHQCGARPVAWVRTRGSRENAEPMINVLRMHTRRGSTRSTAARWPRGRFCAPPNSRGKTPSTSRTAPRCA